MVPVARVVLCALIAAALALLACDDQIPVAPPPDQREQADEAQALPPPDQPQPEPEPQPQTEAVQSQDAEPSGILNPYSYRQARSFAEQMLATLAEERRWCDDQPAVAELRARLEDEPVEDIWDSLLVPAAGEDLRAVEIIAEATAEARGIPLLELPPVFLVSRTALRHWACLYEEIWEDLSDEDDDWTVGRPASRLALLLGQEVEGYGDLEQSWLNATLYWGWYGEIDDAHDLEPGADGVGEVVIVSSAPMPAIYVGVISHELVHFLQDQWTGWRLHDWYRDAQTTDELEALRWVVEGDATMSELYAEQPPLLERLADIAWGPYEHSEPDLWYRAYEALTPQDSENLFAAYDQGSSILAALRDESGQSAIDALLLDPPESTEQLLHARKLEADEQPIALVDLQRLRDELFPATDWDEPIVDRMGEQWLRSLILTTTRFSTLARNTAAGWGSDQMALWQSQDGSTEVVTWQVVFDNLGHHREGAVGLRDWFYSHTANEAVAAPESPANLHAWDGPSGAARLVIPPNAVWLVAANNPQIADKVARGILNRAWTNYSSTP